jgi:hypothetical protein
MTYHLVDTENGTDIDTGVNVTRTVQRVKDDTAVCQRESISHVPVQSPTKSNCKNNSLGTLAVADNDSLVDLLADHDTTLPARP